MSQIGRNIRLIRKIAGLTQVDFGKKFGASQAMMKSYEGKKGIIPDAHILARIARFAGVSNSDLLTKNLTEDDLHLGGQKVEKVPQENPPVPVNYPEPDAKNKMLESILNLTETNKRLAEQNERLTDQNERLSEHNAINSNTLSKLVDRLLSLSRADLQAYLMGEAEDSKGPIVDLSKKGKPLQKRN